MKQLDLEIFKHRNKYQIHLGNGKFLIFDTKTAAKKHCDKMKKLIRDNVRMLNVLQPNINQIYRSSYFQMKPREIRDLKEQFYSFDNRFDYIFGCFSSGNKNAFIFSNIESCFSILINITTDLHCFAQRYKNYNVTSQTSPLLNHLQFLKSSFSNNKRSLLLNELPNKVVKLNSKDNEQSINYHARG